MELQQKAHWCSVASVVNALHCLGIRTFQPNVAKIMCVTADGETVEDQEADPDAGGADEQEIIRALLAHQVNVDEYSTNVDYQAEAWLKSQVHNFGPAVLCVDDEEHWVVCIGHLADRFVVFDSANEGVRGKHQGVLIYTWNGLKRRWQSSEGFYGLGLSR